MAAFPALSEASRKKGSEDFTRILSAGSRHVILWSVISLGLIAVLRAHIVRVIFGTGAFDWDATRLTAALLAILTAGLVAQGLILLFSRGLYAARQSWRPLAYQIVGGMLTIGLALALLALPQTGFLAMLERVLRVEGIPGSPILLVALASSVGQILLALCSLVALARIAPGLARGLARPLLHGTFAATLGGAAVYGVLALGGDIAPLTTLLAVFTEGLAAGLVGLMVAALTLWLLGNEEFADITFALRRLAGAKSALSPSADEPV